MEWPTILERYLISLSLRGWSASGLALAVLALYGVAHDVQDECLMLFLHIYYYIIYIFMYIYLHQMVQNYLISWAIVNVLHTFQKVKLYIFTEILEFSSIYTRGI